jgi:hypothetical protein
MKPEQIALYDHGFRTTDVNDLENPSAIDETRVTDIREWIRLAIEPSKSVMKGRTSYGLKHDAERAIGRYVSNGELIWAMIQEGYTYKKDSLNARFYCKFSNNHPVLKVSENRENIVG